MGSDGSSTKRMRRVIGPVATVCAVVTVMVLGVPFGVQAAPASVAPSEQSTNAVADPAALVNPFVGTAYGGPVAGTGDTFPGASAPFGMLQWSPDTMPDRLDGGGYYWGDSQTTGLSLTHLSGPGCPVAGDVPILPATGTLPATPSGLQALAEPFSHSDESASPGYYQAGVGSPKVNVQLTATQRAGLGQFTFPVGAGPASFVIKSGDSAIPDGQTTGDSASSAQIAGTDEVTGSATTGHFCGTPGTYTLYFVVEFSQPFKSYGTWNDSSATPGVASASGANSGAWVTFDTASSAAVEAKVAISYVSVSNARANLAAENEGWNFHALSTVAHANWNTLLRHVEVAGGTTAQEEKLYTGLYHAALDPTLFSDVNGQYMGFDGKVHTLSAGQAQYTSFSGWDIFRSETPLITLLAPDQAGQMGQSLVRDQQQGGWLPNWPVAASYTGVSDGDDIDPTLTEFHAYGAEGFDANAALKAMLHGATTVPTDSQLGQGFYNEWYGIGSYLHQGYVPNDASRTLDYAQDDFAIAQMAQSLGDQSSYTTYMKQSQNWENLLNPANGYLQPRDSNGSFPAGDPLTEGLNGNGQNGFNEGNAAQYNWLVPQNMAGLIAGVGGNAKAISRLDSLFTQLNAGPNEPHYWAGNESDMEAPWVYDYAGAPYKTQQVVRRLVDSVYDVTPAGEPGNDDLGASSAWLVWGMLGMYPETPGADVLVLGSPLFPHEVLHFPGGHDLNVTAPQAADASPYIQALSVNGQPTQHSWISLDQIMNSPQTTMAFNLGATPSTSWGSNQQDAPPSYTTGQAPVVAGINTNQVSMSPDSQATVDLVLQNMTQQAVTLSWTGSGGTGVSFSPSSGSLQIPASGNTSVPLTVQTGDNAPVFTQTTVTLSADGQSLPPASFLVRVAKPGSLPTFFNNVGITTDDAQGSGDFDGAYSYSADALAHAGVAVGSTLTVNGLSFNWQCQPGFPDNILAAGQTIPVTAAQGAATLGILGASSNGATSGNLTINYTDGTSTTAQLYLSDWGSGASHGNTVATTTPYRNYSGTGVSQAVTVDVYEAQVPIDPTKTVASVTLPNVNPNAGQGPAMHIFSIAAG